MTVIILCLTVLIIYGILTYAYKLWNRAGVTEKMEEIRETEKANKIINDFRKAHRGNLDKKRDNINKFKQE